MFSGGSYFLKRCQPKRVRFGDGTLSDKRPLDVTQADRGPLDGTRPARVAHWAQLPPLTALLHPMLSGCAGQPSLSHHRINYTEFPLNSIPLKPIPPNLIRIKQRISDNNSKWTLLIVVQNRPPSNQLYRFPSKPIPLKPIPPSDQLYRVSFELQAAIPLTGSASTNPFPPSLKPIQ